MTSISSLSPEPPYARPLPQTTPPPPSKAPEKDDDAKKVTASKPSGQGRLVDVRA